MNAPKWYYHDGQGDIGPVSIDAISKLYTNGEITKQTFVREETSQDYRSFGDVFNIEEAQPKAEEKKTVPPPIPVASQDESATFATEQLEQKVPAANSSSVSPAPSARLNHAQFDYKKVGELVVTFIKRFSHSDLQEIQPNEDENRGLAKAGFENTDRTIKGFLAWRRALLWIAGVCLSYGALNGIWGQISGEDSDLPFILNLVIWLSVIAPVVASVMTVRAAMQWHQVSLTQKNTRWAWGCFILLPFLIALIPVKPFIDDGSAVYMASMMSFAYVITLAPLILGLFPGIMRASLTLKTLLPQSPLPGWFAVIFAPIYTLFLVLALIVTVQLQVTLLAIAFIALIMANLLVVRSYKSLTRPLDAQEASDNVRQIRKSIKVCYVVALISFSLWAAREIEEMSFMDVAAYLFSFAGSVTITAVLATDLLFTLIKKAYHQEGELRETKKIDALRVPLLHAESIGLIPAERGEL